MLSKGTYSKLLESRPGTWYARAVQVGGLWGLWGLHLGAHPLKGLMLPCPPGVPKCPWAAATPYFSYSRTSLGPSNLVADGRFLVFKPSLRGESQRLALGCPIDTHVPWEENRPITSERRVPHAKGGQNNESADLGAAGSRSSVVFAQRRQPLFQFQITGHDPTVWWRGSMGLLGFSIALLLWQLLRTHPAR